MEKPKFNLPPQSLTKPTVSEMVDEARLKYPRHTIFGDHRSGTVQVIEHGTGKVLKVYPKEKGV